jgi:site-specific DNA recombinase
MCTMLKLAIAIIRRSSHNQKKNHSLEDQEKEIRARALLEGYELVEIIVEDAISAFKNTVIDRAGMKKLLEMALDESLNIEAVLFYHESRLTRQFEDFFLFIYREIKEVKPEMKFFKVSEMGEWDPFSLSAVLNSAQSAIESMNKSKNSKKKQMLFLEELKRPGSSRPFGYTYKGKYEQIPDPYESRIVQLIFFMATWGYSQGKIAESLNELAINSPNNKKWNGKTIDYILNNPQYLGHLPWNVGSRTNTSRKNISGEYDLIENHHTPIISPVLWILAHQTIEKHKLSGGNNDTPYILRDLLVCSSCNQKMRTKDTSPSNSKKRYMYYVCPNCKGKVDVTVLNDVIIQDLAEKLRMREAYTKNEITLMLSNKLKVVKEIYTNFINQLKLVDYKMNLVGVSKISAEDWSYVLKISKSHITKEMKEAASIIEQIHAILQDTAEPDLKNIMAKLDINNFTRTELRTLCLINFKEIRIDLKKNKHVSLEYMLFPFIAIEEYLDKL